MSKQITVVDLWCPSSEGSKHDIHINVEKTTTVDGFFTSIINYMINVYGNDTNVDPFFRRFYSHQDCEYKDEITLFRANLYGENLYGSKYILDVLKDNTTLYMTISFEVYENATLFKLKKIAIEEEWDVDDKQTSGIYAYIRSIFRLCYQNGILYSNDNHYLFNSHLCTNELKPIWCRVEFDRDILTMYLKDVDVYDTFNNLSENIANERLSFSYDNVTRILIGGRKTKTSLKINVDRLAADYHSLLCLESKYWLNYNQETRHSTLLKEIRFAYDKWYQGIEKSVLCYDYDDNTYREMLPIYLSDQYDLFTVVGLKFDKGAFVADKIYGIIEAFENARVIGHFMSSWLGTSYEQDYNMLNTTLHEKKTSVIKESSAVKLTEPDNIRRIKSDGTVSYFKSSLISIPLTDPITRRYPGTPTGQKRISASRF